MTDTTTPLPPVVDRDTWTAQVNDLRVRETAHTARATRSPPPGAGCRWSKSTPRRRYEDGNHNSCSSQYVFHTVHEPVVAIAAQQVETQRFLEENGVQHQLGLGFGFLFRHVAPPPSLGASANTRMSKGCQSRP